MNLAEIKGVLSLERFHPEQAFELCKSVALVWQDSRIDLVDSLDAVIRLTARRNEIARVLPGAEQMINDVLRQAGLFPYIEQDVRWTNRIACELMKVPSLGITLHLEQMKVFGILISGKSLILSAPTSFGKSLMVDALISLKKPSSVVIVVPTLALLDEYRKRLRRNLPEYNVITQDYQHAIGGKNIYIGTQERIASRDITERINLFVIDEFYKLDLERGDERALALNAVMARYAKSSEQIYLLGPSIDEVSRNVHFPRQITFHKTSFSPVATDIIDYSARGPNLADLTDVLASISPEPTLIFVRSPESAARLAYQLIERVPGLRDDLQPLCEWLGDNFHPEWVLPHSIKNGIGIHHGRIPRSIGQYVIHLFNRGRLPVLICTSTLIEGVNTVAKNIIIYDKFVSTKKLDRFTYDNIKGRAGRMFQHFVGRVFLFNTPQKSRSTKSIYRSSTGSKGVRKNLLCTFPKKRLVRLPEESANRSFERVRFPLTFYSAGRDLVLMR